MFHVQFIIFIHCGSCLVLVLRIFGVIRFIHTERLSFERHALEWCMKFHVIGKPFDSKKIDRGAWRKRDGYLV
jgi:hypothetical protein